MTEDITAYDLFDILSQQFKKEDLIIIANSISDVIIEDKNFGYKLAEEVENYAEEQGLCPLCGKELQKIKHYENTGEMIIEYKCECGWEE